MLLCLPVFLYLFSFYIVILVCTVLTVILGVAGQIRRSERFQTRVVLGTIAAFAFRLPKNAI